MPMIIRQDNTTTKDSENILSDNDIYYLAGSFKSSKITPLIKWILEKNMPYRRKNYAFDTTELTLMINSPGGNVEDLFALIDVMEMSHRPIRTVGIGQICSCAIMAFMAGAPGRRFISRNTSILSHQYTWGSEGKHHELMATVSEFENTNRKILELYKLHTKQSEQMIKKVLLKPADSWITPEDAIEYGIADKIL
jgi:ATP-dependent Clp endopeptidase proteolytic subunit ClpP